MKSANKPIRPTFAGVDFGEAVESPIINFITAIDLNNAEIRIPYENFETKVSALIENYMSITSCRNMLSGEPCFQIMQGTFEGQIAAKQFKISGMGLNPQSVCFTVLRKPQDFIKKVQQSKMRFSKLSEANIMSIVLVIQGKEINYEINTKDSFSKLKTKLIANVPEFGKYTADSVKLQHNGMFLKEEALLQTYAIENGAKIIAVIKKNLGCFKKDCLVTCTGNRKVPICEIKAGDAILSYNKQKKVLEEDRVTFVHTSILQESIVIKLTDGSQIQTTANHLFLCNDDEYRMVQFEEKGQALTKGSILKLATGKEIAIDQITSKTVHPAQTFYHLCIENNHNFIVDNFIAHNMLINIKTPNGQILKKDVNPTIPILHIKQQLEAMYYMTMENFKLLFAGKQLNNARTLSDENISKDSIINLMHKKLDKFNYVAGETKVLTAKGTLMAMNVIKSGDEVVTYDVIERRQCKVSGKVISVIKTVIKEYIQIYLDENKTPLIVASDCYFQLYSGEVVHAKTLSELPPTSRPELKGINGNKMRVTKISCKKYPQSQEYFKLNLDNAHNYVVQGSIIHDLVLHVAAIRNNKRQRKISFGAHIQACTIGWAKQRVKQYTGIAVEQQVFTLDDRKLQDEHELLQYRINSSQLIVATQSKSNVKNTLRSSIDIEQLFQEDFMDKNFHLMLSLTEKIVVNYHKYSERTVQQIMKELVPDCKSSYFFLFEDLIIFPDQLFSKLEESQYFKLPENEVIVVRNQKLAFIQNMSIKKNHIQNYGYIKFQQPIYNLQNSNKSQIAVEKEEKLTPLFESAIERITGNSGIEKQFKKERFYMPFLYYTSRQYDESIYRYIRFFEEHKEEVSHQDSVYCIIRYLYINMNLLPNYIGPCVCGMRNFRFSKFFSAEKVFYWHSFTSARRNDKEIVRDLKGESGTLFYVNSLTGKEIKSFSLYPDEGEILFAPFSYFLVVKVQEGEEMDRVWLDEMPSPITFQKNIVLWVDDFPKNNIREINSIIALKDVEVLQLTSTVMAEKWIKQFGWLLDWKGLEFKLISDMARYEGLERVDNKQAGIDLLQKLYTKNGFTTETLIYCGNAERAKNLARARNLAPKYYSITEDEMQVQKFCEIIPK